MRATYTVLIGIVTCGALLLVAAGAEADETQGLWDKNCAACHGADGKGDTKSGRMLKVEDLTDPAVRSTFDREALIKSIKEGIPKEEGSTRLTMPAYAEKLSEEQVTSLVDFVQGLASEPSSDQASDEE
jgi:mono/diheme cytochrome c family protein